MLIPELTVAFNKNFGLELKVTQVYGALKNHKFTSGRKGQFTKGHIPWNVDSKGKKLTGANSGSFKKGQHCPNKKPLGHERICKKDGYVLVKVSEKNPHTASSERYKHKHIVIWESINGPVPKNHVVTFVDGDKGNFDKHNLKLIHRDLLCRFNQARVYGLPNELIPTMKNIVELKTKIQQRDI